MPTQRFKLNSAENQAHRARLSNLKKLGIPIGDVDPRDTPDRFTLEQTDRECALVYELPSNEIAVIVPAKLTVRKSGILITDMRMTTSWDDWPLDLWHAEDSPHWTDVIGRLYHQPPTILNDYLVSALPLRPRQIDGVVIAHGYTTVPWECSQETVVAIQLLLEDERRDQFSFEFDARLDRRVMRKFERRREERSIFLRSNQGRRFAPWGLRDQASAPQQDGPQMSGMNGSTCDAITPKPNQNDPLYSTTFVPTEEADGFPTACS